MTDLAALDGHSALIEPATLRIERLLPGPIERVWDHLTQSDLRRRWLAGGEMTLALGAPFALTWRNDELTDPPGERPEGFGAEHSMQSRITELDPPRRLGFAWGGEGGSVTIDLAPQGRDVLLTLTHRRLGDRRAMLVNVSTGWHVHLDLLGDRLAERRPQPFWSRFSALKAEYERRVPA